MLGRAIRWEDGADEMVDVAMHPDAASTCATCMHERVKLPCRAGTYVMKKVKSHRSSNGQ